MNILTFDQNTNRTGFAWFEAPGQPSSVSTSSFACDGNEREKLWLFCREIRQIISRRPRPDIVVWEAPLDYIVGFVKKSWAGNVATVNASQLLLRDLHGALTQACVDYNIPYDFVLPGEWRPAVLGKGTGKLKKEAAKAKAVEYCQFFHIHADNHDEAEAACIAVWASTCSQVFKDLRWRRGKAA